MHRARTASGRRRDAVTRHFWPRRRVGHAGVDRSVRGVIYVLMVQRPDSGNSDASEIRRVFQQTAADALPK